MKRILYLITVLLIATIGCSNSNVDRDKSENRQNPSTAVEYYNRGCNKMMAYTKDNMGAIADFSEAIWLDPDFISAYSNRAYVKAELQDYRGAILDYTKAIEISIANVPETPNPRGYNYHYVNEYDRHHSIYSK